MPRVTNFFSFCTALALGLAVTVVACRTAPESAPAIPLQTRADSVAWSVYQYVGGPAVWDEVPFVRFDFRSEAPEDTARRPARRHLWDRRTGDYRLEMTRGDSLLVVLFNVGTVNTGTRAGTVYVNGTATADTAFQRRTLERAYGAYINDTYWTLMPTKLFDEGVTRTYVPDSSTAAREVIQTSFQNVGLTPGDRYWLFVDRATGQLQAWCYHLEGDTTAGPVNRWAGWQTLETPHGVARLAARHEFPTGRVIHTENLALPQTVDPALFTSPAARLE
jgi:hypothetical protein